MKRFLIFLIFAVSLSAQVNLSGPILSSVSGTITASGSTCTAVSCVYLVPPLNSTTITVQLSGTFTGSVNFEASVSGTVWNSIGVGTATTAGTYNFSTFGGNNYFRAWASALSVGSITVSIGAAGYGGASGNLAYPGVVSDGANGLTVTGGINAGGNVAITGNVTIGSTLLNFPQIGITPSVAVPPAVPSGLVTVAYNSNQIGGGSQIYPSNTTTGIIDTTHFTYWGGQPVQAGASGVYPSAYYVIKGGVPELSDLTVAFAYTGQHFDLYVPDRGQLTAVYIDGYFVDCFQPALASGTATAGGSTTITLAGGSSSTNGYYNQNYVAITGGTGSGQVRQITSYAGSTLVATVSTAWGTNPDGTSVYQITANASGVAVAGVSGGVHYIDFVFPAWSTHHLKVVSQNFMGVNIGPYDSVAADASQIPLYRTIVIGDSFAEDATGGPDAQPGRSQQIAAGLGMQSWPDGEGGTGWVAQSGSLGRMNYLDRIAPPSESWQYYMTGTLTGSYTISVTYGGTTQTTATIPVNSFASVIQTAIQALSNLPASSVVVAGYASGNGNIVELGADVYYVLLHSSPGATLTINTGGVSGLGVLVQTQWTGVVAQSAPTPVNGAIPPFLVYVQGSGNDNAQGFTSAQVGNNAVKAATALAAKYPYAKIVFGGILSASTIGGGTIQAADTAFNSAISGAAALLPLINGLSPFIDTYSAGIGGNAWIYGSGTVGAPASNSNSILISIQAAGHLWTAGWTYLAARELSAINNLFALQ